MSLEKDLGALIQIWIMDMKKEEMEKEEINVSYVMDVISEGIHILQAKGHRAETLKILLPNYLKPLMRGTNYVTISGVSQGMETIFGVEVEFNCPYNKIIVYKPIFSPFDKNMVFEVDL